MTEVRNGVLDYLATGLTVRDAFAIQILPALLRKYGDGISFSFVNSIDGRDTVYDRAYRCADELLLARDRSATEAERQKRLADMGQQLVDLAETGASWECPFCSGIVSGPHDTASGCSLGAWIRDAKSADTEPAPPMQEEHEDVGLAVSVPAPAMPTEAARLVGASRNGGGT